MTIPIRDVFSSQPPLLTAPVPPDLVPLELRKTIFLAAISGNEQEMAKEYLDPSFIHEGLHLAIAEGFDALAEWLLNQSFDEKALHLAAQHDRVGIARLLLDRKAKIEALDGNGNTPLLVSKGKTRLLLIERGANVMARTQVGWTALHQCQNNNEMDSLEPLLAKGACLHAPGQRDYTVFHVAAAYNRIDVIIRIRSFFKDSPEKIKPCLEARNDNKETPLHLAALYGHVDIVRELINAGSDPEALCDRDRLPMHLAARHGHLAVVQILIHTDWLYEDLDWCTPVHLAIYGGHPEVVDLLLQQIPSKEREFLDSLICALSKLRLSFQRVSFDSKYNDEWPIHDRSAWKLVHSNCQEERIHRICPILQKHGAQITEIPASGAKPKDPMPSKRELLELPDILYTYFPQPDGTHLIKA